MRRNRVQWDIFFIYTLPSLELSLDAADVCGACPGGIAIDAADLRGAVPGEIVIGCCRCVRGLPWRNCHWMLPMWEGLSLEKLSLDAADVGGAVLGEIAIGCY